MNREWNGSKVMEEFVKIAADSGLIVTDFKPKNKDFVGNPSEDTPVKDHRRYEPTEEYDVTEKKDLVQAAHPEKVQVADAMGEGGVVENQNEQQEKNIDIAIKMPSGALIGVHADLVSTLINVATQLDAEGKHKEAVRVDETIKRLKSLPFENSHLYKEAAWGAAIWGIVAIVSAVAPYVIDWFRSKKGAKPGERIHKSKRYWDPKGGGRGKGGWTTVTKKSVGRWGKAAALAGVGLSLLASLGHKVSSLREGIKKDSNDLVKILEKSDNKAAATAANLLRPHAISISNINFSSKRGFVAFEKDVKRMYKILPQLEKYIIAFTEIEDPSILGIGLGISGRTKEKFDDFKSSLEQATETISKLRFVGVKADANAKVALKEDKAQVKAFSGSNKVKALQKILFTRGFPKGEFWQGEVTGKLDETTVRVAKELENKLDTALSGFNKEEGLRGSFQNEVMKGGQIVINPRKLLRILRLIEKYTSSKD